LRNSAPLGGPLINDPFILSRPGEIGKKKTARPRPRDVESSGNPLNRFSRPSMTLSPESLRYLMLPKLGEPLPWLTESGGVREEFNDSLRMVGVASPEETAVLAREIWEGEAGPEEKRLGWRLKDRPDEFCAFLFAGINGSGLAPELAEWRASVRQRTLAVCLAQVWIERREQTAEEAAEEAAEFALPLQSSAIAGAAQKGAKKKKKKTTTIKSIWWAPSPLGTGTLARLGNAALANLGSCFVAINLFASFGARALGLPHLSSNQSLCASIALVAWLGMEMFFKYKVLGRVNSLPIWLWARAQLPSGGWLHGRAMEKQAQRHWGLHGMTAEQAKQTASAHLGSPWRHRNAKENARAAQSAALWEQAKVFFSNGSTFGEIWATLNQDEEPGGQESGMALPPEIQKARRQLARLDAEIKRVDESADLAVFAQRIAARESAALAREIQSIAAPEFHSGATSFSSQNQAEMSGRKPAKGAESDALSPQKGSENARKPRRL